MNILMRSDGVGDVSVAAAVAVTPSLCSSAPSPHLSSEFILQHHSGLMLKLISRLFTS